jgi:ribosomal protein L11 methyltransferase
MTWRQLELAPVDRAAAESLSAVLVGLGASGVQEDWLPGEAPPPRQPWDDGPEGPLPSHVSLKAWFEDPDEASVDAGVARAFGPASKWTDVEDVDWETSWHSAFPVLHLSPRVVIAPPWDPVEGAVVIDPGQGFGTGSHETTAAVCRAIDALTADDTLRTALDVGCGSGILALVAAQLGLEVRGIDIDAAAIENALHNAALNGRSVAFSTDPIESVTDPADLVLANLFAETLAALSTDLIRLTRRHLVLAGILGAREAIVRAAFDPTLGEPVRDVDGEWVCLHYAVGARA